MNRPVILTIDGSLQRLEGAHTIELSDWHEAVRFGCSWSIWSRFKGALRERLPESHGTVCMGSGDFHHVSHLLLDRMSSSEPFDVAVLDNHPDNMRFPFGIHCGSWVVHAARLPQIRRIHVLGITSADVSWRHALENHLLPLFRGKIQYWTTGVDTRWSRVAGLAKSISSFGNAGALVERFIAERDSHVPGAVYVSIDKDVFAPSIVRTNWDQGCFTLDHVRRLIEALKGQVIGSDISGEVSIHHYQTVWKRCLSALDRQPAIPAGALAEWQSQQTAVTCQLLNWLQAAGRS